jgi:hypothetical protein
MYAWRVACYRGMDKSFILFALSMMEQQMPRKSAVAPEPRAASRAQRPATKAATPPTKAKKALASTDAAASVKKNAAKPGAKSAAKGVSKPAAPLRGGVKPATKTAVKAAARALSGANVNAPANKVSRTAPSKAPPKAAARAAPRTPAAPPPAQRAPTKDARPVLVRDSFTMPEQEYAVLLEVKQACLRAGIEVKKSELLRIGVALLGQLDVATLQGVLAALPQLKTGRPPVN